MHFMWNYQWLSCIVSICYFISILASSDVQAWAWSPVRYPEIGLYLDIYIYFLGIVIYLCIVVYFTNARLANRFSSKVPMRPRTSSSFIPSSITLICIPPTLYLSSPFFVTQAHIMWSYVFPNGELSKTPNSTPQTRFCRAAYSRMRSSQSCSNS